LIKPKTSRTTSCPKKMHCRNFPKSRTQLSK